ncbi:hypothetical protein C9994_04155 [Marivirga lumbricoides]|uniref:Lipocalin-like domain-containing protein n=1 Tax=Marivirga lumbricoides TaxID=1046115 RepID=A0A2T4DTP9_9BACT|nr:hypothetical protein C9994_04155 [Marivirga lumbricoides]
MKKLIKSAFLFSLTLLMLQACSKDEDKNTDPETVVGIWTISELDPDVSINGVDITDVPPELLGLDETESLLLNILLSPNSSTLFKSFQIQFGEDNKVVIISEEDIEEESTYSFSNNQLVISQEDNEEEIIFSVSNLTDKTMNLMLDQTIAVDLDENGTDENLQVSLIINLIR